ncbi:MAG: dephospho-CoA kinase [Waddliaceae bacterium]
MLKLNKVAVTGGLASGKTTVCRILKDLGAYVVSTDLIVHHLLTSDSDVRKKVIDLLGPEIMVDKQIDRSRISRLVFNHPRKLRELEEILHPIVLKEINKEFEKAKEASAPLFVVEIPLLYEVGWEELFDYTITVTASDENSWERFRKESGYERDEFDNRMRRQLSPALKAKKSDVIVKNDGSIEELNNQVKKTYQQLTN